MGGPGKSLLYSDLVCPPGGHCLRRGFCGSSPEPLSPPCPASATGSHQVAVSSAVYSTWGMGSPLGRGLRSVQAPSGRTCGEWTGGAQAERPAGHVAEVRCLISLGRGSPAATTVTAEVTVFMPRTSRPFPRGSSVRPEDGVWVPEVAPKEGPYCLYWKAISAISFLRWRYAWSEKPWRQSGRSRGPPRPAPPRPDAAGDPSRHGCGGVGGCTQPRLAGAGQPTDTPSSARPRPLPITQGGWLTG